MNIITDSDTNYYAKYIKYKTKYISLIAELDDLQISNIDDIANSNMLGGSKNNNSHKLDKSNKSGKNNLHDCKPNKPKYSQICLVGPDGKYETQEKCENECDPRYIAVQLKRANLYRESLQFYFFIKDLSEKERMGIYIKGGNVIGLAVLKMIYNAYSNNEHKFRMAFNNFLKMELIKDWDFTAYTDNKEITPKYREKLDKIASKQKLVPRAKTFILYQAKVPILIYEKALFEIAISDLDTNSTDYSKMEIPLTTMKVKITKQNIKYIFMLAKSFYSWTEKHIPIDLDIVKKIISNTDIIIHAHKSGFYNPNNKLDAGELNKKLVEFINDYAKGDIYHTQFLITQMEDPYRLVYRMGDKNIKKTEKICEFIDKNLPHSTKPSWLLDTGKTTKLIDGFANELGKKLVNIYKQTNSLYGVLDFLDGANFGKPQIQIEWDEFGSYTKDKLDEIFGPLVKHIGLNEFKNIINTYKFNDKAKASDLTNAQRIVKLFRFLDEKKFFK